MNEYKKVYAVFDGEDLITSCKNGFEVGNYKFWYSNSKHPISFEGTNIMLTREQVVDVLEFYTNLNGKNVYEFSGNPEELLDKLQTDTTNAISGLNNIGDYTNAELIEKLNIEENKRLIDEMFEVEDAVKRPSHYMLEDGTEVKNHIRSILGDDGFKSWAIGNAIKYVSRYKDKGKPIQDLKKAQENIQMVIDVLGEQDGLD